MQVVIAPAHETAAIAAGAIAELLRRKPTAVLGLATGSSPLGVYDELARLHDAEGLSFAQARGFMLDEYVGLPADHPERYRNVIEREIASRVGWDAARVQGPDGLADDLDQACADYEQSIRDAGGVDLQLLGIGTNGHVAFNEPTSSLASRTRVETLTAQTRKDNARFFGDDVEQVPTRCLTQGIGTILEARHLVLLAQGEQKAEAVRQLVEGPISALWPATALQQHPHVTVLVDEAAASRLTMAEHYRETWAASPRVSVVAK